MSKIYRIAKCNIGMIGVIATYFVVYGFIITKGHGIPYVMDNNETFSSLNHAYNLWNFSFFQSFGLADEAASPFAAAHPVVHTHQGNFPRLFSVLLFSVGARSAEAQIWITTFSVGLASILMAYVFFQRRTSNLFATFVTLMLMTDYLLFAQWQVNTYRVWHGFFLFASLLCVHGLSEWKRSYWAPATIILYASLLYWELVFASFVAITAGAYTIWIYRRMPRLIVIAGVTQTIGAVLGIGILICQLILYLGWHDFLADIKLTYTARNFMEDNNLTIEAIRNFYAAKNVIFWSNYQHGAEYSGITAFLRSVFDNILQVHTLLFAFTALSLAIAAIIADFRFPNASNTRVASPQMTVAAAVILMLSLFGFLLVLAFDQDALLDLPANITALNALSIFSIFATAVVLSIGLLRLATAFSATGISPGFYRRVVTSVYFGGFGVFVLMQGDHGLWFGLLAPITGWTAKLVVGTSILVGGLLLLTGAWSTLAPLQNVPGSLVPFFTCGVLGYLFVYKFNAGYLHTGYLYRLCPLLVFHVDALLALGPFSAFAITTNLIRRTKISRSRFVATSVTILFGTVCALLVGYWGIVQYRYFSVLPPDRFFLAHELESIASPNEGIVSNAYAIPFAILARTWGYMDPDFGKNIIGKTSEPFINKEYLWLADRQSNNEYRRPAIFVCFQSFGTFPGLINRNAPDFLAAPRCLDIPANFKWWIPDEVGVPIGNLTDYGGLAASFDRNVTKIATSCSSPLGGVGTRAPRGYNNYIGKDWGDGVSKRIIGFRLYPPSNQGMMQSAPMNLKLQGSNDNAAWTDLYTGIGLAPGEPPNLTVTSGIDSATAYRFHRVNIQGNGVNSLVVCQVQFFEAKSNDVIQQIKQDALNKAAQDIKGVQQAKLIMQDEKRGLWAVYRLEWSRSKSPGN